jgi:hypothetical protein
MLNELRNRNTQILAGIALVVGILFGWWVLGWGLFPVEYKDGNPPGLAAKYKTDYLQMVADSYAIDQDLAAAQRRLQGFDKAEQAQLIARSKADLAKPEIPAGKRDAQIARLQRLSEGLGLAQIGATTPGASTPVAVATTGTQPAGSTSPAGQLPLGLIVGLLGLLLILGGAAGILYLTMTRRSAAASARTAVPAPAPLRMQPAQTAPIVARESAPAPVSLGPAGVAQSGEPPLGHFVTTYKLGDDGYDTSFSIELPTGEFLGECGVGISDLVGDGPQKVTAFEVWLFDKNDIKTVTKVIMSDYAYNNDGIRKKLQARGDAVLATKGQDIVLETESLRVRAAVSDMAYGSGGTPQSFFSKLTIELAPQIKNKMAV